MGSRPLRDLSRSVDCGFRLWWNPPGKTAVDANSGSAMLSTPSTAISAPRESGHDRPEIERDSDRLIIKKLSINSAIYRAIELARRTTLFWIRAGARKLQAFADPTSPSTIFKSRDVHRRSIHGVFRQDACCLNVRRHAMALSSCSLMNPLSSLRVRQLAGGSLSSGTGSCCIDQSAPIRVRLNGDYAWHCAREFRGAQVSKRTAIAGAAAGNG